MTNDPIDRDELKRRLRTPFVAGGLRLAVLFGSAAHGKTHVMSDIDIGFVPLKADLSLDAELALQVELTRAMGRDVDLIRLDRAPTLVRWEALRGGIVLFESGPFEFARARAIAASEYFDFAPALEVAAARFRRRIAVASAEAKTS